MKRKHLFYKRDSQGSKTLERGMGRRPMLFVLAVVFVLVCGTAYAADSVGLVDSQKIMFQHPRFDETTKILILLSRTVEGSAEQLLATEQDPERRRLIMSYSTQITEFAELDHAISAELNPEEKNRLSEDRQNKLSELEGSLMGPVFEECKQAIQAVMLLKNMTVLVELESVYYGGTDITEDVIKQLGGSGQR